ncbi:MAG: hypothetical protein A7315_01110 [Candidatus Altiarchaeales archaeon WOR_SM1_79]|nr:MAG: hypothetical protein A7315_01110 [Candidatus Altiarchaeales archaeon WOR_SM1_79]
MKNKKLIKNSDGAQPFRKRLIKNSGREAHSERKNNLIKILAGFLIAGNKISGKVHAFNGVFD